MAVTQADIDSLATAPGLAGKPLINGQWSEGEAEATVVISPLNGQPLTTIASESSADVARAVASARDAFERGIWSRMARCGRSGWVQQCRSDCCCG